MIVAFASLTSLSSLSATFSIVFGVFSFKNLTASIWTLESAIAFSSSAFVSAEISSSATLLSFVTVVFVSFSVVVSVAGFVVSVVVSLTTIVTSPASSAFLIVTLSAPASTNDFLTDAYLPSAFATFLAANWTLFLASFQSPSLLETSAWRSALLSSTPLSSSLRTANLAFKAMMSLRASAWASWCGLSTDLSMYWDSLSRSFSVNTS